MTNVPDEQTRRFTLPASTILNRIGFVVCGTVCYLTPGTTKPVFAVGALCFFAACIVPILLAPDPPKPPREAVGRNTNGSG